MDGMEDNIELVRGREVEADDGVRLRQFLKGTAKKKRKN